MKFTEEDLLKFQRIYKKRFGKDLSRQEILEKALLLIDFFQAVRRKGWANGKLEYNNN